MRSNSEIANWLTAQPWLDQFLANAKTYWCPAEIRRLIRGEFQEETIRDAFPWMDTPEGVHFWVTKAAEFNRWYWGIAQ